MSLVQSLLSELDAFGLGPRRTGPPMDWRETPEAHIFMFDLPGLSRDDVKLQVHDDRVLHVSSVGRCPDGEEAKESVKWHCRERGDAGSFVREFRLPEDAAVDEVSASMKEGVLVVRVGKRKGKKKKKKHGRVGVEIEGGDSEAAAKGKLGRFVCCKA